MPGGRLATNFFIICMVFLWIRDPLFFGGENRLECWGLGFPTFPTVLTSAWLTMRPAGTDVTTLGSQEDQTLLSFCWVLKFRVPCSPKFEESVSLEHQFREIRLHARWELTNRFNDQWADQTVSEHWVKNRPPQTLLNKPAKKQCSRGLL